MVTLDMIRRLRALKTYAREQGLIQTVAWLKQKLVSKLNRSIGLQKDNVLSGLDFLLLKESALTGIGSDTGRKTLNWFIPPFGRGSGGHLNIFRFIANLEALGFTCNIILVEDAGVTEDEKAVAANIARWFLPLKAAVFKGLASAPEAHVSIATEWRTAYYVRSFAKSNFRCYFVQDFEPWFFPIGSEYCFAEETYRFGFIGITAGGWLRDKLAQEYGMETHAVGFSYERELYSAKPRTVLPGQPKRVFFYARPPTPRRAFELGILALRAVCERISNVEVVLAGWDLSRYDIPFKHQDLGVVPVKALADVYNTCDVALVLSLTNLSLLPLELMACGVPIVSNDGPNNAWLLNAFNAKLSRTNPTDLANAVCDVLNDTNEAHRLIRSGLEAAHQTSWTQEAERMGQIFDSLR
jgi:glycosyltransferase involved in cell wall biosynthesis